MVVLGIEDFTEKGVISEASFFERLDLYDWESLRGRTVLVKGCRTAAVPPWAFMALATRLAQTARSVRFGNGHSYIVIFDRSDPAGAATTDRER